MNDEARPNLESNKKMVDVLGVGAVFGEPIREGNVTVVPGAEVRFTFGYGYGSGPWRRDRRQPQHGRTRQRGWQWRRRPGLCQRLRSHLCRWRGV